jgi:glycosyltransferase involved in cell wall biosynthesis
LIYNWRDREHPRAGGAEVYTHEIARYMVEQGHDVTIFCSSVEGRERSDVDEGVRILRSGSAIGVYKDARIYWETEGRGVYDVVVDQINTRPFLCPSFVKDVPVVALAHQIAREVWFHEFPLPAALVGRFVLEPRWLKLYRDVPTITVSNSTRHSLVEHGFRRITVLPEGLSLPQPLPKGQKERRPTVVFVGRLASNKRPHDAVKAFQIARRAIPDAQMWVIGSGPLEAKLRRNAPEGVTFLGRTSQLDKYERLARAHALVATSVREGWGLVVSEAAAVGTVSMGYDVPGLRDSIPASEGKLSKPRPQALAQLLVDHFTRTDWQAPRLPSAGGVLPWDDVGQLFLDQLSAEMVSDPV